MSTFTSPPEGAIDIGHDTWITKVYDPDGNGWVAVQEWHREGEAYGAGFVPFRGRIDAATSWEVVQEEPLTLAPSIACGTCGHHGWIRDGKWVPA